MFNFLQKSRFLKIRTRNITSFDFEQLSFGCFLYDIYKKDGIPCSFRHGVIRCENIISKVYNIKS